jgi:hypothetical protein
LALAIVALTLPNIGCESLNQCSFSEICCKDELFSGWRDHVWAKRAYHRCFPVCEHGHPSHFRRGFIAGYSAVCSGEDGYMPAVPPRDYWGYSYQSAEGHQMAGAWFEGYPEGVQAAMADGAGRYRDVQISTMLNQAMQPQSNVWAPYANEEMIDGPPILSGEEAGAPIPEPVPSAPISESEVPLGSNRSSGAPLPMNGAANMPNYPQPSQSVAHNWDLIR